jgi:alkaline phosphatase D
MQQPWAKQRSLLGAEQETWLNQGLATSQARWNILAQQTLMAQHSQLPIQKAGDGRFWTDGWDGYPATRKRLFDDLQRLRPANPVVISGDVHAFYAAAFISRSSRRKIFPTLVFGSALRNSIYFGRL